MFAKIVKNMKKRILLPNRYNYKNYLVNIDTNRYYFEPEKDWCTMSISYSGYDIKSFDPDGGPFITRNFCVDDYIVTDIKKENNSYIFYLEKNDK